MVFKKTETEMYAGKVKSQKRTITSYDFVRVSYSHIYNTVSDADTNTMYKYWCVSCL